MQEYTFLMPDKLWADVEFSKRIGYLRELISKTKGNIVFIGGAGVSTGSGIPDFRGDNGLYKKGDPEFSRFKPEYLLSHQCYSHRPSVFYKFYHKFANLGKYEPCDVHKKLAQMEHDGIVSGIITQNVDLLHEKAGSVNVQKIHGTIDKNHCVRCNKQYTLDWMLEHTTDGEIPRCDCGGQVKPDVVLYNENVPADIFDKSLRLVDEADCLIVGGTSLEVGTASYLVEQFCGSYLIIINNQETAYDERADIVFREDINKVFSEL